MAAPKGNQYAKGHKGPWGDRLFTDTIRRAILQNDGKKLRDIADSLVAIATAGEKDSDRVSAIKEIADRVDGKVPQAITGPDGGPVQIQDVPWVKGRGLARS